MKTRAQIYLSHSGFTTLGSWILISGSTLCVLMLVLAQFFTPRMNKNDWIELGLGLGQDMLFVVTICSLGHAAVSESEYWLQTRIKNESDRERSS